MSDSILAILNGEKVPLGEAKVSALDRGFLFGDGIYEVLRIYQNRLFLLNEHWKRLENSLAGLKINIDTTVIKKEALEIVEESKIQEGALYIQVTRGADTKRSHPFPDNAITPTRLIYAYPFVDTFTELREKGANVITFPDIRWQWPHIKSLNLLGNVFASQKAKESKVIEAIFVNQEGNITEGSHTNAFAVIDGKLRTMPLGKNILPGVTRHLIMQLVKENGIPTLEKAIHIDEIKLATEFFITSTLMEVLPIIQVDETAIHQKKKGPVTDTIQRAFRTYIRNF